ncbi:MAG: dTDP-4-dehydrorhamnose 3,5-epimerase family protein [Actinomycetota bacterium]|nr:dTDP-4-dehydrorhamnose 3,5-epimerase family protein [Actinomycetota bacterium]
MRVQPLSIEGVWLFEPVLRPDERGVFLESFAASAFNDAVGHALSVQQMNISVSRRGTVRGIHFADVPPGQAKYVQCLQGRIVDVVVDIRVGSPTFGAYDAVELDDAGRSALYIAEGLGHAFCAMSESATVGYLCSEPYAPAREHGIHPLDPDLGLPWPAGELTLSPKDDSAPTFAAARADGLLPYYADCRAHVTELASRFRG